MDAQYLKEYIIINDKTEYVLEELGCKHIRLHNNTYYSCAFPFVESDNKNGMLVYIDNLYVHSNTKNIKDKYGNSDIVSLICYVKDMYFTKALKWLADILGLDYYKEEQEEIPESLQYTKMLIDMSEGDDFVNEIKLKPISEKVLSYYKSYVNDMFYNDGISYSTQREFEIGFDIHTQRYTIPIRDELGTLVGVKGRYYKKDSDEEKYLYLEPCSKSQVLYGLYKTMEYIKEKNEVIVVESEKSVMVLWSQGIRNVVAIGGHDLSKTQVEKITRLGIKEIILCYDEDVNRMDNGKINKKDYISEANKFIEQIKVTAMVDISGNILSPKESPVDDMDKFNKMYEERKVLQNGN